MKSRLKLAVKAVLLGVTSLHLVLILVSIGNSDMSAILGHMVFFLVMGLLCTELIREEDLDEIKDHVNNFINKILK